MGISIHLNISRSVTAEKWDRVYKEVLTLVEKLSALYYVSVSDIIGEDDVFDKIPKGLRDDSDNMENPEQAKEEIIEEFAEDDIPAADESENTGKADLAELLQTCFAVGLILVGMFGIIRKLTGKE